ncbi:probable protein ycsI [Phialocephala subalpina]|uniref:Probable protein ycsI n=1 Tax=Phialocephala subalpina TaxID=576137 RepID=A0A1L7XF93_9HELO|nr:probable protein ycsI [Phialocephala subalpina]
MPSFQQNGSPEPTFASETTFTSTMASNRLLTGASVRKASRNGSHRTATAGLAPTYLQANLIILPSRYATDFRLLCARNPVPCPLLAESKASGSWDAVKSWVLGLSGDEIISRFDVRRDAPKYMVYRESKLVKIQCDDILSEWSEDHIAFFIGCSFSFESALANAGLPLRHSVLRRNVPMYRTQIPLCPAGVFTSGTYVVSMRPYRRSEIEAVRNVTRPFMATHGEPLAWGWEAVQQLGIKDIDQPEWGDAPLTLDGRPLGQCERGEDEEIPVFWGCGVTPQEAVMRAGLQGTIMAHAPGHMLVLDCRDWDIMKEPSDRKPETEEPN